MFVRPGSYPRVEHLQVGPLRYAMTLLTNIFVWKGQPGTHTLAYHKHSEIKVLPMRHNIFVIYRILINFLVNIVFSFVSHSHWLGLYAIINDLL